MSSATEELRRLLDERGVEYMLDQRYRELFWDFRESGKARASAIGTKGLVQMIVTGITPEQAIAATLGRGMLTADDVRDLIERHSDASGGNGRDFLNGAYVAIADELNATLGPGTCHADETETFECVCDGIGHYGERLTVHVMECSECGHTYEHVNGGYECCPHCGRRIVEVDDG